MSTPPRITKLTPEEVKEALAVATVRKLKRLGRYRPAGYIQVEFVTKPNDTEDLIHGVKVWFTREPWGKHPVKI